MTGGSSTEHDHGPELNCLACYYDEPSQWQERSVDEINEGVRQALAALDGSRLSAVALLTGISIEKLIELGGTDEDGEHPAVLGVRDPAAGEQGVPR